jgi:hypothetical protein
MKFTMIMLALTFAWNTHAATTEGTEILWKATGPAAQKI